MEDFIYSDKFDDYLKGRLSKNEKISLEDEFRQDPLLRSEVKLQQDIYFSLGEARRSYLKGRLNQVPVNTSLWYEFTGIQLAAIVSSFIFLAGGIYFYTNYDNDIEPVIYSDDIEISEKNSIIPLENLQPKLPIAEFKDEQPGEEAMTASTDNNVNRLQSNEAERNEMELKSAPTPVSDKNEIPNFVRPDVLSHFKEDSQQIDYDDFEVPDKTLLQASEASNAEVEIETLLDSKYTFHYQLFNNKLYLHGDFQGIPYKVIALNQEDNRRLFLEYNGSYYKLKLEQNEVSPLEAIQDSSIINILSKISE
ncbi:hypothetical protein WJR50_21915 [Catalinimonas sp. 4WD22]|uniref:hypothetical protein n=1 Tax=Catalinimonas locisalis TaxID=3133978 RepID=UPI00310142D2